MSKTTTRRAPAPDGKTMLRAAKVRLQSFNADENTVDLVWTTGAAVERYGWTAMLSRCSAWSPAPCGWAD